MIVLTSLIAAARLGVALRSPKKIQWEDGWLVLAYIFFLVVSILYQVVSPPMFRLEALGKGEIKIYSTVSEDGLYLQKIFFVTTSGLWFCLWSVKASLLALYKRVMTGVKNYIIVWWIVVSLCFVVSQVTKRPTVLSLTFLAVPRRCSHFFHALLLQHECLVHRWRMQHAPRHQSSISKSLVRLCSRRFDRSDE